MTDADFNACLTRGTPVSNNFRMDEDSPEPLKLIFALIFLLTAGILNEFVLAYIHDLVGHDPLPDLVFWLIPEIPACAKIGDFIVMVLVIGLITLFIIQGMLYGMRIVSLIFTQLPPCFTNFTVRCEPQIPSENRTISLYVDRVLRQVFHAGFQDMDDRILCGDLLFSGHTLIMVCCAWLVAYYLPKNLYSLGFLPKILAVIGMVCMVISRGHYSIDVIFAYWLSIGVFSVYHTYAEIHLLEDRRDASVSHWLFVRTIVAWLENNKPPGKIENEFEIPFLPWIQKRILWLRRRNGYNNMEDNPHSDVAILIDAEPEDNVIHENI